MDPFFTPSPLPRGGARWNFTPEPPPTSGTWPKYPSESASNAQPSAAIRLPMPVLVPHESAGTRRGARAATGRTRHPGLETILRGSV